VPVRRTLVLVANHADASGNAPLDDLPGAGRRFDVVCRFVTAALLTSHGVRTDTDAVVLFTSPDKAKALRFRGGRVRSLSPDERSTAGLLNRALRPVAMPVWQETVAGVESRTVDLATLVSEAPRPLVVLTEQGAPDLPPLTNGATFVLGDHRGLAAGQEELLDPMADASVSLGPVPLQADQAAVVLHNRLDVRTERPVATPD